MKPMLASRIPLLHSPAMNTPLVRLSFTCCTPTYCIPVCNAMAATETLCDPQYIIPREQWCCSIRKVMLLNPLTPNPQRGRRGVGYMFGIMQEGTSKQAWNSFSAQHPCLPNATLPSNDLLFKGSRIKSAGLKV